MKISPLNILDTANEILGCLIGAILISMSFAEAMQGWYYAALEKAGIQPRMSTMSLPDDRLQRAKNHPM